MSEKPEPKVAIHKICVEGRFGAWYAIASEKQWVEVRVTPTGLLRVGEVHKERHPVFAPDPAP